MRQNLTVTGSGLRAPGESLFPENPWGFPFLFQKKFFSKKIPKNVCSLFFPKKSFVDTFFPKKFFSQFFPKKVFFHNFSQKRFFHKYYQKKYFFLNFFQKIYIFKCFPKKKSAGVNIQGRWTQSTTIFILKKTHSNKSKLLLRLCLYYIKELAQSNAAIAALR